MIPWRIDYVRPVEHRRLRLRWKYIVGFLKSDWFLRTYAQCAAVKTQRLPISTPAHLCWRIYIFLNIHGFLIDFASIFQSTELEFRPSMETNAHSRWCRWRFAVENCAVRQWHSTESRLAHRTAHRTATHLTNKLIIQNVTDFIKRVLFLEIPFSVALVISKWRANMKITIGVHMFVRGWILDCP
jgi:hypothetical protein